jgi:Protein of unknown function (DUF3830)
LDRVRITAGAFAFFAVWESELSPNTCRAFRSKLPFSGKLIHARWSGEACWIPLGAFNLGVAPENAISRPKPGQILFYPADISETEILIPYGETRFCSSAGELAGNRLLTITEGLDGLAQLGKSTLWTGSCDIRFEDAVSL